MASVAIRMTRCAFERLFALKQRPPTQGVLLIAADFAQVERYIDLAAVPPTPCSRRCGKAGRGRIRGSSRARLPCRRGWLVPMPASPCE